MNKWKAVRDEYFLDQLRAAGKTYGPMAQILWRDPDEIMSRECLAEVGFPHDDRPELVVNLIPPLVDRVREQAKDIEALSALLDAARDVLSSFQFQKGVRTKADVERHRKRRERGQEAMRAIDEARASLHFHGKVQEPYEVVKKAREI